MMKCKFHEKIYPDDTKSYSLLDSMADQSDKVKMPSDFQNNLLTVVK